MRVALVTCFDSGASFGLDDDVFPEERRKPPDEILQVGISNPLGEGLGVDLCSSHPEFVRAWSQAAREMVDRDEMELGWTSKSVVLRSEFNASVVAAIGPEVVLRCELTIFAIGTVLLWIEVGPHLDEEKLRAVAKCFEFAAYRADVGAALRKIALGEIPEGSRKRAKALNALSERPEPEIQTDATGYSELKLVTSFTRLVICIDKGDDVSDAARERWQRGDVRKATVVFEYHGKLHFGWGTCVIEPRDSTDRNEPPALQIQRMLGCIKIAHVFLGTCEAFEKLFASELTKQVGHYVGGTGNLRSARALNQLRTLARAVISLTNFARVTATEEDQTYFRLFEALAGIESRQAIIRDRCEVLYDVQLAEARAEDEQQRELDEQRQTRLNTVISFLTGVTFADFLVSSFAFIWTGSGERANGAGFRLGVLSLMVLVILLLLVRLMRIRAGGGAVVENDLESELDLRRRRH